MPFEQLLENWSNEVVFPAPWYSATNFTEWIIAKPKDKGKRYGELVKHPFAYCVAVRKVVGASLTWLDKQANIDSATAEKAAESLVTTLAEISKFVLGNASSTKGAYAAAARQLLDYCSLKEFERNAAARTLLNALLLKLNGEYDFGVSIELVVPPEESTEAKSNWCTEVVDRLTEFRLALEECHQGRYRMLFPVVDGGTVVEDRSELCKQLNDYGALVNVCVTRVPRRALEPFAEHNYAKLLLTRGDQSLGLLLAPWSTYLLEGDQNGNEFPGLQNIVADVIKNIDVSMESESIQTEGEPCDADEMVYIVEAHPITADDLQLTDVNQDSSLEQRHAAADLFSLRHSFQITGESLGLAIGIVTLAAHNQRSLRPSIMTGAISCDDSKVNINAISGVPQKLRVAADFVSLFPEHHKPLIIFPSGNASDLSKVSNVSDEIRQSVLIIRSLTTLVTVEAYRRLLSDGCDLWRNAFDTAQRADKKEQLSSYECFKNKESFSHAEHCSDFLEGLCNSDWQAANDALHSTASDLQLVPVTYNENPKIVASWLLVKFIEHLWPTNNKDGYLKPVVLPLCLKTLADGVMAVENPPVGLSELSQREKQQRLCAAIAAGIDGLGTPLVAHERDGFLAELADALPILLTCPGKLILIGYDAPSNSLDCGDEAIARRASMLHFLRSPLDSSPEETAITVRAVVSDEHYFRWGQFELEALA